MSSEKIGVEYYSIGLPVKDESVIVRDNYLSQIKSFHENGNKIVFIEGDVDSGKSSLCAQFVRSNLNNTISVFFNPNSEIDYNVDYYCSNFIPQARHIIGSDKDRNVDIFNPENYRRTIFELRKHLKHKRHKINIIIDGLENKLDEQNSFINQILDLIPFGEDIFNIVLTGNKNKYFKIKPQLDSNQHNTLRLVGFSKSEIQIYLSELNLEEEDINEIITITKGLPGRLKTVKRVLKDNKENTSEILNKSHEYSKWLELDCKKIDLTNPLTTSIISVIVFSDRTFTVNELAQICKEKTEVINSIVNSIEIIEKSNNSVSISSDRHKKYLVSQLRGKQKKVNELLTMYYASDDSVQSTLELTKLRAKSGEWGKVVNMLSSDILSRIITNTGSLNTANDNLRMGVRASIETKAYSKLWRFSIESGLINELDNFLFWESEIDARISINDFSGAINIAESAVIKIDRLRLLVLIARKQKEKEKLVDEELIDLIKNLYSEIDLHSLGTKIYDIVGDLLYAIPNLAIELIEKSSKTSSDTEKSINDWIITKLSFAAIDSSLKEDGQLKEKKVKAVQKLNNPKVEKINKAISFMVGNYTSEKVLLEMKKMESASEKLRFLRLWLNNNKSYISGVDKVMNESLDLLIEESSNSTLTIDLLKELSTNLSKIKDEKIKRQLLKRFEDLEPNMNDLGLAKNKYIYRLNIIHTRYSLKQNDWEKDLNKLISEINEIGDTLIKLESFSEVYNKLHFLKFNNKKKKIGFVYAKINELTALLYSETASHMKVSEYFLKTIGKVDPFFGIKIIERINTSRRRDKSRINLLDSYLGNSLKYINHKGLHTIYKSLEGSDFKEEFIVSLFERYSKSKHLRAKSITDLLYFAKGVADFKNKSKRLFCYVLGIKIINKNEEWKTRLLARQKELVYNTWHEIDTEWDKIDSGFLICSELSGIAPEFAKKIFNETELIKKESTFDSPVIANTFRLTLKILMKAFVNLFNTNSNTAKEFKSIKEVILRIPSKVDRVLLWSELGFQCYMNDDTVLCKTILDDHILPSIADLLSENEDISRVQEAIMFLHLFNPEMACEYANNLSKSNKEQLFFELTYFYLTKRCPFDIYEDSIYKYPCDFSDLKKSITTLKKVSTDSSVYILIKHICEVITTKNKQISQIQRSEVIQELNELIEDKLPDSNNITHSGYKILANLKVQKPNGYRGINHKTHWLDLIDDIKKIDNRSDRIFILAITLDEIPFDKTIGILEKGEVFDIIIDQLEGLKIHYEYVQRVIDISEYMYQVSQEKWKKIVKEAFNISSKFDKGSEVFDSQKDLIDSMYRLDKDYAKSLVMSMDRDSNAKKVSGLLKEHFESLEISSKIKNNKSLEDREKESYRQVIMAIINSIKSLNADRISPKKIADLTTYLTIGNSTLPLKEAFPAYMYFLINCGKLYKSTALSGPVRTLHEDNFNELLKSFRLIELLNQRKKIESYGFNSFFIDQEFSENKTVSPGSREEALDFIGEWMKEEAKEFIIIADPYLVSEDLEILKMVNTHCDNDIEVNLLGSKSGNKPGIEKEYSNYWNKISDESAPYTKITFCWIEEGGAKSPFHDRWIITKGSGLRIGTSLNSLGVNKESEISVMDPSEALNIQENSLQEFIYAKKRVFNNHRVSYKSFTL